MKYFREIPLCFDAPMLGRLFDVLKEHGFELIGPRFVAAPAGAKNKGTIALGPIESINDLPCGITDEQEGGIYRLKKDGAERWFGFNASQHSCRNYFQRSRVSVLKAERSDGKYVAARPEIKPRKKAFIGVRSCDLHAVEVQDRVFLQGKYSKFDDPFYRAERLGSFFVALNCTGASSTCFCVSQGTGPKATILYDLALTEMQQGQAEHRFLLEVGSEQGREVASRLETRQASDQEVAEAEAMLEKTALEMKRSLNNDGIKELMYANLEHPRWENVASRCLACTNCTMVCPTCFCTTIEDFSDISQRSAERIRVWDSCFTLGHSYVHGGSVRKTHFSRYRQWLMHKVASWWDQYECSGCVGCGRCITWCPVGIDITEECAAIRQTDLRKTEAKNVTAA
jgi:sulfhydrogenase subunit beta (sulfur reductase)